MATHATLMHVRPFAPARPLSTPRSGRPRRSGWFTRALVGGVVALVLAGAPTPTITSSVFAAPGNAKPAAVPNLAPGNAEIDIAAFWSEIFADAGLVYSSPIVVPFSAPIATGCGTVPPAAFIAFYCVADVAVYWSIPAYDQAAIATGDAAWVNVIAHEWSHHLQLLLGIITPWSLANDVVALELQATCMGGVYVADARARDLVDDAMIAQMVGMFGGSGSHGTTAQVQTAFLGGLEAGIAACGLALPAATTTAETATTADADSAESFRPGAVVRVTAPAVNLRAAPSTAAAVRAVLSPTNRLEITGPAQSADGYTWWPVTDRETGESGYVAAPFLAA